MIRRKAIYYVANCALLFDIQAHLTRPTYADDDERVEEEDTATRDDE